MVGAEIYASVGNDAKVQHLISTFGIPRSRIFNSRDSTFLPHLMKETEGKGVDVVLNSLSGELLHASVCIALLFRKGKTTKLNLLSGNAWQNSVVWSNSVKET